MFSPKARMTDDLSPGGAGARTGPLPAGAPARLPHSVHDAGAAAAGGLPVLGEGHQRAPRQCPECARAGVPSAEHRFRGGHGAGGRGELVANVGGRWGPGCFVDFLVFIELYWQCL